MPPAKQAAAAAKSKRKHEEMVVSPKPAKMSKEEKALLRAKAAQSVAERVAPVGAGAKAAKPAKTAKAAKPASATASAVAKAQTTTYDDRDSTDDEEEEITSPTKKRRIGESKPSAAAPAPSPAPAPAPSPAPAVLSPKEERKRKLASQKASAIAYTAQRDAATKKDAQKSTTAAVASRPSAAKASAKAPSSPPSRRIKTTATATTTATGTQGDRKPSYRTTTTTTTAAATPVAKKSHRMDDKMPFHSPKPQTGAGTEAMSYVGGTGKLSMGLPCLADPIHVETVDDEDDEEEEEEVFAYAQHAAAAAAAAAEPEDKVVGKSEWRSAVAGFLLVVLTAFAISGLYETGVVSGDVLGGGLRSFLQSMESKLESGGDQAWMYWSSSSSSMSPSSSSSSIEVGGDAAPSWLSWFSSSSSESTSEQKLQKTLPCFKDSPMEDKDYYDVVMVPHCADPQTVFLPCPKGAWCEGGALERCNRDSKHFEISAQGDQCVLSAAANATILEFEQKLYEWTVQDGCSREGCPFTAKHLSENGAYSRPLFYYSQLVGEFEEAAWDMKLLEVANAARYAATGKHVFFTMRENDNHLIGLHPDQHVALPMSCALKRGIVYLVGTLVMFVWLIFRAVFAWILDFMQDLFYAFPLVSTLCSVAGVVGLWSVYMIRSEQRNKQQLLLDVVECREKVCQILADRQEHQTIHIRDQISFQVCPTSKVGRKRIQAKVWPRVVGDIRQDTRIHKRVVAVGTTGTGEKREYWKWVDAADPAPGHVRFNTGTGTSGTQNGQ